MRSMILWAFTGFTLSLAPLALAQSAGKIVIDGSTGVTPLVAALTKAYVEQNPSVAIDIGKGMGTRARIDALRDGKIDIAMASHGLKVDDITRQGMTEELVDGGSGSRREEQSRSIHVEDDLAADEILADDDAHMRNPCS